MQDDKLEVKRVGWTNDRGQDLGEFRVILAGGYTHTNILTGMNEAGAHAAIARIEGRSKLGVSNGWRWIVTADDDGSAVVREFADASRGDASRPMVDVVVDGQTWHGANRLAEWHNYRLESHIKHEAAEARHERMDNGAECDAAGLYWEF